MDPGDLGCSSVVSDPGDLGCSSVVSEIVMSNACSSHIESTNPVDIGHNIDWDSLEILPLEESQIGAPVSLMDEEAMFAFVGLTSEEPSVAVEGMEYDPIVDEIVDVQGADLPVDDRIPSEDNVFHDMDDPPMDVGTIYACMNDFRREVKQHAIKVQFALEIEKSNPYLFRGYCKADGCPWSIIARLMSDEKQVRVQFANLSMMCTPDVVLSLDEHLFDSL